MSEDFEGRVTRRRCPQIEHKPLTLPEVEAWRIVAARGAWRARPHPRWKDAGRSVLDWPSCRAAHDPAAAPWSDVRPLLSALERGAGEGEADLPEDTPADPGDGG
ncbi:MAG: hypothetical protein Q8L23_15925 [Caulobacter sp.]|nr:hypothetical protein [Caulobacter sp.]